MFEDLVAKKLVIESKGPDGLRVVKYHRRVFYDNLWGTDDRLLEARGIVLDADNQIAQIAFRKVQNHGQYGTAVDPSRKVVAIRKINGFLGVASVHKNQLLVSTTGSITSDYAAMARKWLDKPGLLRLFRCNANKSFMFEIVDPVDAILHPIQEEPGAYLIGAREKSLDTPLESELSLDTIASFDDLREEVKRPERFVLGFGEVLELAKKAQHEGWMIRDAETGETLCKIKTSCYLVKKALMRLSERNTDLLWKDPAQFKKTRAEEEQYELIDNLVGTFTADQWKQLSHQTRKDFVEQHYSNT